MRFRFDPTYTQRAALRAQLACLLDADGAKDAVPGLLAAGLPAGFQPVSVHCTMQRVHADRFVVQAQLRSSAGEECAYALKVYADDFGERVWAHAQALARHLQPNHRLVCLPNRYIPHERMLVFPWFDGEFLNRIVDDRKPELLRQAARLVADLHRVPVVPERLTTARELLTQTRTRADRLAKSWPPTSDVVEPLLNVLEDVVASLDPADPAPVHGDLGSAQFVWTGVRLVLLDLDRFGYTDPAYDAGHFLAQVERSCLVDDTLLPRAGSWVAAFRDTYLSAMPQVSPRNVAFYHSLTLTRKIYNVCRRDPAAWPTLVPRFAERARAALREAEAP